MFQLRRQGAVARLRHVHPPYGFLTAAALSQLRRQWRALEADASIRVILLEGTIVHTELHEIDRMLRLGARLPRPLVPVAVWLMRLCAWILVRMPRLGDLLDLDPVGSAPLQALLLFHGIQRSSKITLAALDGPCIGGGLELSLCFDYRIARDEDAHVIGCPEVQMGLIPGFGGSQRLERVIGTARARELLLEGALLTPREAARVGIVSRLLPREGFDDRVAAFAARMARRPPLAVAALKRVLADSLWSGLWRELGEVMRLLHTRDVARGLEAYRAALRSQEMRPDALLQEMEQVAFTGT